MICIYSSLEIEISIVEALVLLFVIVVRGQTRKERKGIMLFDLQRE